jgi:hypothetical protein
MMALTQLNPQWTGDSVRDARIAALMKALAADLATVNRLVGHMEKAGALVEFVSEVDGNGEMGIRAVIVRA